MIGFQAKAILLLGALLIGAGLLVKHLLFQQGFQAASLKTTAEAAERSIESERRAGQSLAASERARAVGVSEVADLRRRAEKNAQDARAAREAARQMNAVHRASQADAKAAKAAARSARADAKAATDRALSLAAEEGCPPMPEITTCPADSTLRQP